MARPLTKCSAPSRSAWPSRARPAGGGRDWCEIGGLSDRMSSRRINSRLEPQLSAGVPRFPPWPAALNCLAHAAPSGLLNGIFTVQPYDGSRADSRAGSTEAWCFQFARTWCYLTINLQTNARRSHLALVLYLCPRINLYLSAV